VQLADAELFVDPFVQALQVVASVGHPPGVVLLRRFVQIIVEQDGQVLQLVQQLNSIGIDVEPELCRFISGR